VRALLTYDYAIVRVVPRVERGEFVNAGIILSCDLERVLGGRIDLDDRALLALDAAVDMELVRSTLATIPAICEGGAEAGPIGKLSARERFGCAPQYHGANIAGAHRAMPRSGSCPRSFDGNHG
jgi:hypothetical protein